MRSSWRPPAARNTTRQEDGPRTVPLTDFACQRAPPPPARVPGVQEAAFISYGRPRASAEVSEHLLSFPGAVFSFPAAVFASRTAIFLGWPGFWLPGWPSRLDDGFFGFPGGHLSWMAVFLASRASGFLPEPPSWAFFPPGFLRDRDPGDLAIRIAHPLASTAHIQESSLEYPKGTFKSRWYFLTAPA